MEYLEIECILKNNNDEAREVLIAYLATLDVESFFETEKGIKAYLPIGKPLEQIKYFIENNNNIDSFQIIKIKEKNWNKEWEGEYKPVFFGNKCVIRASFHKKPANILYDIVIDPKMSFGTGHHESTFLMVQYLLEMDVRGLNILDMGCGTGILSILASMKGAASITAVDNNDWACQNAIENVKINKIDNIEVINGNISTILQKNSTYNMILANIERNVLINDMPDYCTCLNKDGGLIMSGILKKDYSSIKGKARDCPLIFISDKQKNDWIAVSYKKN